jgi:hypothetical protein
MPLSIGLEIEAIVLSLNSAAEIPRSTQAQLQLIANAISATGVVARAYMPTTTRASPNYTIWNVVVDSTIDEVTSHSDTSDSAYQSRFGVELVSPTYYKTDESDWKDDIQLALGGVSDRVSWKANRSAGLHVHVGRGLDDVFTLPQLKRLAILVCRFEGTLYLIQRNLLKCSFIFQEAIDTIHPNHRVIDNDNILSNRYNAVLKDLTLSEIYALIQAVTDIAGLVALLNHVGGYVSNQEAYDGYHDAKFFKVGSVYTHFS